MPQAVNGAGQGSYSEVGTVQTSPWQPAKTRKLIELKEEEAEYFLKQRLDGDEDVSGNIEEETELYLQTRMVGFEFEPPCDNGDVIMEYVVQLKSDIGNCEVRLKSEDLYAKRENDEGDVQKLHYVLDNLEAGTEYR